MHASAQSPLGARSRGSSVVTVVALFHLRLPLQSIAIYSDYAMPQRTLLEDLARVSLIWQGFSGQHQVFKTAKALGHWRRPDRKTRSVNMGAVRDIRSI